MLAIMMASSHSKLQLIGISVVYGNSEIEHTFDNCRRILNMIGRNDIKVYKGIDKPLIRNKLIFDKF